MKNVEVEKYEDEDVAEKMVTPPNGEGMPNPELLVEHLHERVDDLVKKHWSQIMILKYLVFQNTH